MELTPKQVEYFAAMEGTFNTPGWTLIRQGWEEERESLAERMFFNAKSYEDVSHARVRYGLLNELINLPSMIEQQRQQVLDQPDEDETPNV